jgi:hypothetical protein
MPGRGGIMVYVSKACDATYLEELQSEEFESIWLKLHHPDPVVLDPSSEDADTSRPLTIGNFHRKHYIVVEFVKILDSFLKLQPICPTFPPKDV